MAEERNPNARIAEDRRLRETPESRLSYYHAECAALRGEESVSRSDAGAARLKFATWGAATPAATSSFTCRKKKS